MNSSISITLDLEKATCNVCAQTIYRFDERERWKHVVPDNAWSPERETLWKGHYAAPAEEQA